MRIRAKWTPDEIDQLAQMWAEGEKASIIAEKFQRTEKGVTQKLRELKLRRAPKPKKIKIPVKRERTKVKPYVQPPFTGGKHLLDIKPNDCHYPYADKIYCGDPANKNYGYCQKHHEACYKRIAE